MILHRLSGEFKGRSRGSGWRDDADDDDDDDDNTDDNDDDDKREGVTVSET